MLDSFEHRGTDTNRNVVGVSLGTNFTNKGSASGLHPVEQCILFQLSRVDGLLLVKVLVKNNRGLLNTFRLGDGRVTDGGEKVVISMGLGKGGERLVGGLVVLVKVSNNNNLVHGLDFLEIGLGNGGHGRKGLLNHVGNNPNQGDSRVSTM